MDTRTETTKRQAFAVLWHSASHDNVGGWFDSSEVLGWLELTAFPLLFGEGHCFRCHGFGAGSHKPYNHQECQECLAETAEREAARKIPKGSEPFTEQQIEDILNGKPIEEMKRLKDSE